MKILLALIFIFGGLTGCKSNDNTGKKNTKCMKKGYFDGHTYIIYNGFERGGLTHDPDCVCKITHRISNE